MDELKEKLMLLLIYLSSWDEEIIKGVVEKRAWKGYDFDVLNRLDEKEYIDKGSYKSKSLFLTDKGIEKAKELLKEITKEK